MFPRESVQNIKIQTINGIGFTKSKNDLLEKGDHKIL